jgi:putative redox protein
VRREQEPRRYTAIHVEYHLAGDGLDESRARRAIDLSLEKYCSVAASLAPDIKVTYGLTLA